MNLLNLMAGTMLAIAFATSAMAQGAPAQATDGAGLTRTQVHAQLVDAQRKGVLPDTGAEYPPSKQTVARNREIWHIRHHADGAGSSGLAQARTQ